MTGTSTEERIDEGEWIWMKNSLLAIGGVYRAHKNGTYVYVGERPGVEWTGHGYFPKWLTVLVRGQASKIRLYKHRWIHKRTGETIHSRPPDDPCFIRFCTLVVVLRVWAALSSEHGFHNRCEAYEGMETGCGSDRTVQRWTSRMMSNGLEIQQAIRLMLIEESEPRPMERLFEGGLSPPYAVMKRRWHSPQNLGRLYLGIAMLLVASRKLAKHTSCLLAGARRRWPKKEKTFGI
jgi:hypothetical protein